MTKLPSPTPTLAHDNILTPRRAQCSTAGFISFGCISSEAAPRSREKALVWASRSLSERKFGFVSRSFSVGGEVDESVISGVGLVAMTSSGATKVSGGGAAKGKGAAVAEVKKKVDGSGKPVSIVKKKPINVVIKPEAKKITSSLTTVAKTSRVKAQKKVYSLPGQKYDIPAEREPLRMFYESLLEQIPSSEMAESWMMEHGLLSPERAKKAYERKQKRQQQLRMRTPIKSTKQERPATSKELKASKSVDPRSKKRINYSNDEKLEVKLKRSEA